MSLDVSEGLVGMKVDDTINSAGSEDLVAMKVDTGIGPKTWPSRLVSASCQDSSTCLVASLVSLESGVRHWPSFLIDDLFLHETCTGANCFVEVWEGNQDLQD